MTAHRPSRRALVTNAARCSSGTRPSQVTSRPPRRRRRLRQLGGSQVEQRAHDPLSVGEPEPRGERGTRRSRVVAVQRLHVELAAALEHAVEQRAADALVAACPGTR